MARGPEREEVTRTASIDTRSRALPIPGSRVFPYLFLCALSVYFTCQAAGARLAGHHLEPMMKTGASVIRAVAGIALLMLALDVCAQAAGDQVPDSQAAYDQAAYDHAAPGQAPAPAPALSPEQLDQLLAPIALYPDALLAQVLTASTYPLEIVEADRWLQNPANAALSGEALNTALQQQPWDPSVKSLVPFPQILRMMDDHLNWTEQLGDAFLANRAAVMDSVQRLRQQAQAAGNLKSGQYGTVTSQGQVIVIESPNPEVVYVPVYDPFVVYGPWPYPAYPPYYFGGYFDVVVFSGGFGWFGFGIDFPLWNWCFWDWPRHRVFVNQSRFNQINFGHRPIDNDTWHHDPEHRHGVPYRYENTRQRFLPGGRTPDERRNFRGYPNEPRHEERREQGPGHEQGPGRERGPNREQNIVQPLPQVVHPMPQVVHPMPQVVRPLPQLVTPPVVARPPPAGAHPQEGERHDMQQRAAQPPPVVQPQAVQPGRTFGTAPPQQFRAPEAYRAPGAYRAPQPYRTPNPPPAFESFGRGSEVRSQSERGYSSRHSEPGGGARTQQFAPAPGGRMQQSAPQGGGFRRRDH